MATSYTNRLGTSPEEGVKSPCVVATTANITLSGAQTIDSVSVVAGDRVLVKDQTDGTEDGIYDAAAGAWTRATDWNAAEDVISGILIPISSNGALYQGTWSGTFTVDTTEPTFTASNLFGVFETVITTNTITNTENGKTFVLSLVDGFVSTLPAPFAGASFKFIVGVAPTTAYTVVTDSSANIIHGQVVTSKDAAGDVACAAASDTVTFVAIKAIIGDWVKVVSDGTSWFVSGMCDVQDGITTTQVS